MKLTITEIYPGVDFPALAMSEVVVQLGEELYSPPASLSISSVSASDNAPESMLDGNVRSAWIGDTKDGEAPASITVSATGFGMSRIGIQRFNTSYDRPKKVKLSVGTKEVLLDVKDSKDMQWLQVPSTFGYTGSTLGDIKLEIVEVYKGSGNAGKVAIAELTAKATQYDALTF